MNTIDEIEKMKQFIIKLYKFNDKESVKFKWFIDDFEQTYDIHILNVLKTFRDNYFNFTGCTLDYIFTCIETMYQEFKIKNLDI